MIRKPHLFAISLIALLFLGCSEAPKPEAKKEPPKPAEPVSGQSALFKMYQKARTSWAQDAQVVTLNSIHVPEVAAAPGKAGAWQATFASTSLGKTQTLTYSVVEQEGNLHQGVFSSGEGSWSGRQGQNTSFDIRAASTDSEAAYKAADAKAADYDKTHPGMSISFLLEKIDQYPTPVWRVIWGESVGTSNFSIYVNAANGEYLGKMH